MIDNLLVFFAASSSGTASFEVDEADIPLKFGLLPKKKHEATIDDITPKMSKSKRVSPSFYTFTCICLYSKKNKIQTLQWRTRLLGV